MKNEKLKNIFIIMFIIIIFVLVTLLVLLVTNNLKHHGMNVGSENNSNIEQNINNLLTEAQALTIGKDLYKYAHRVGNCEELKYLHNQPGGSIVLNYDEVTSKFTQNYIDSGTTSFENVFRSIKKGEDGKYYDSSVCGFGSGLISRSVELEVVNISENYIMFDAVTTTTSHVNTDYKDVDIQTFAIKKENNTWKIDVYKFIIITEW